MIKAISQAKVFEFLYDTERECPGTLFQVKSLEEKYIKLLKCHDIPCESHVTRFADILLSQVDGLEKKIINNKVMVYFTTCVDNLLYDHAMHPNTYLKSLRDVVKYTRTSMTSVQNQFENSFSANCQASSILIELLSLISMLIDGVNIDNEIFSQSALTSAQQIMFNFRINKDKNVNSIRRHLKHKETPISIYITLKLYVLVRSKTLIERLHSLGICISYDRLLDITKDISETMLSQYERDGVFLPSVLKKDIFTMIAKDNVDFNAKSSTASKHFHGTSMSVLQFPSFENPSPLPSIEIDSLIWTPSKSKKVKRLP